jgi:hypothetical protein
MVIAAAGALSVATAASATAATWGQEAPARADGSAEITQETNTHGAIAPRAIAHGAIAHGAVMRQLAAPEAMAQKATAQEWATQESTAPGALVAPRLAVTDQIAGPIAETATEQGSATWVQRAYQVRLAAVQDAIAQRKAAAKAAAARAGQSQPAQSQAAQSQAARGQAAAQSPAVTTAASGSPQQIAQAMLGSFGWSSSQFSCLDPLWAHESGWSVSAYNAGSGAFGIPQALPGSRMASAGPDWQTNAATQIKWGLDYIKGTYGSPCGAWSHEEATGWY